MKREDLVQPETDPGLVSPEPAEPSEKRQHARFPVSVGVEVIHSTTGVRISGRATDFGVGGCYVDTLNTFSVGTAVEVLLTWRGRTLQMRALVSYAERERSIGMGLAFTGVSVETGASLLDWVAGLSNNPPLQETESAAATGNLPEAALSQTVHELLVLLARKQVLSQGEANQLINLLRVNRQ